MLATFKSNIELIKIQILLSYRESLTDSEDVEAY